MLVLTRNNNQSIMIGDNIVVTILGISGNQVRLGISAPADIPVHREEVAQRIAAEATRSAPASRASIERLRDSGMRRTQHGRLRPERSHA